MSFSFIIQDEGVEVEEIEMEVDEPTEEETIPPVSIAPSVPSLPSVSSNVKIRKDYNPKGKKFEYVVSW